MHNISIIKILSNKHPKFQHDYVGLSSAISNIFKEEFKIRNIQNELGKYLGIM